MANDVVIAGGGFGGLYAARRLERRLPRHSAHITLVSSENFMLYSPLLPGAASGSLEPRHVVVPLREELAWTELRLGRVTGADPGRNELAIRTVDGRDERLHYDQLIVALGSVSRVLPVPGLAEYGVGFHSLADAIALRNRAIWNLEVAESMTDSELRSAYLTFVFVGAGYAGVEGIAEMQDFVADVIERYPRCRLEGARFVLVEDRDRIMPEIPPSLADFATRELRRRGMEIRTGRRLASIDENSATLSDGERIPARTVCWTAGVAPSPVIARLGLPVHESTGRLHVDPTTRVEGHDNVWAVGDSAAVPDPAKHRRSPSPPTAQHALRQGKVAADNVVAALVGRASAAIPLPNPRRVRGHGPAQGRGHDARRSPSRLSGLVRGPDLPRGPHARHRPEAPYHHRLDGGAVLRPCLGRAGPARPSASPRRAHGRRRGAGAASVTGERIFREGRSADLRASFELTAISLREAVRVRGVPPLGAGSEADFLEDEWKRQRPLLEFIAGQPDGEFWVCEEEGRIVGYVRMARFDPMDELSELAVHPERIGTGIGNGLLERCWPEPPTRERGRVVVTLGTSPDLTLYTRFGVMPVAGHWHLRQSTSTFMERRSLEATDATEPAVHVLTADRAVEEWKLLEPLAIGHKRPALHEFFGRSRSCLAVMRGEEARSLCWVSPIGEIGPAVGATPEDLLPRGAGRARPGGQVAGAGIARRLLHDRLLVAARPAPAARVQGALAELGDVVRPAPRAGPLPAHPSGAAALTHLSYGTDHFGSWSQGARPTGAADRGLCPVQACAQCSGGRGLDPHRGDRRGGSDLGRQSPLSAESWST